MSLLSSQSVNSSSAKLDPSVVASMTSFNGSMIFLANSISNLVIPSNSWVMDNGATHHVCNNLSLFSKSHIVSNCHVNLPT